MPRYCDGRILDVPVWPSYQKNPMFFISRLNIVNPRRLRHFFETNFAQEILDMFTMADKDEDGKINYEEFLIMITPRKVAIRSNYSSGQLVATLCFKDGTIIEVLLNQCTASERMMKSSSGSRGGWKGGQSCPCSRQLFFVVNNNQLFYNKHFYNTYF